MPSKKRARADSSSNNEARSAATSACSSGFDDIDGGPECAVYIQMRGIQQVRIRGRFQRGGGSLRVPLVPAQNVSQNIGLIDGTAHRLQLSRAPPGARLGTCGDENLHLGVRKNDRPDITTI